ncbi:MAG: hypothetical protein ABSB89_09320 [Candidatus Bathyarchaeia archaeon]
MGKRISKRSSYASHIHERPQRAGKDKYNRPNSRFSEEFHQTGGLKCVESLLRIGEWKSKCLRTPCLFTWERLRNEISTGRVKNSKDSEIGERQFSGFEKNE